VEEEEGEKEKTKERTKSSFLQRVVCDEVKDSGVDNTCTAGGQER
jgi:hypothetical protein